MKIEKKKAKQPTTHTMRSADSPAGTRKGMDSVHHYDTRAVSTNRAKSLQVKTTENRKSVNFTVKIQIRQTDRYEISMRSAPTDRLKDMLECLLGKRNIAQLHKTTDGLFIFFNYSEGNFKLIENIKHGNNIMDLEQGI